MWRLRDVSCGENILVNCSGQFGSHIGTWAYPFLLAMTFTPTRREIVLVVILLATFSLTRRFDFSIRRVPAPRHGDNIHSSVAPGGIKALLVHKAFRTHLSWGSAPVPDTKIIAHVPGEIPDEV
jgi:hypothetical protein